jgi:hypothetical protein
MGHAPFVYGWCHEVFVKYIALKELPHGQQPGDVFDVSEAIGHIFVLVGAARLADPADLEPSRVPRRRYQRRDLESSTTA